jgi:RNA polymerase sigma-70 factor (ECF subfamily)
MSTKPISITRSLSSVIADVEQHLGRLHSYIARKLSNPADADDLAQEVWLRLLQADPKTEVSEPLAFLRNTVRWVLVDWWRQQEQDRKYIREAIEADIEIASNALSDRSEDYVSITQYLDQILKELPPMQAAVLLLHKRDGLSYEEVATKLGLAPNTVKKYLTMARTRIRLKYRESEEPS